MTEPELPFVLQILREACEKYGYGFDILDTYSKHLVEVSKGTKSFITGAGSISIYPLNLNTPALIANDKAHTYTLLKKKGFRIPHGDYFFLHEEYRELRGDGKELEDAFRFAEELGYPVFVKPNRGSVGNFAELIYTPEQLKSHLAQIAEEKKIVLIQEPLKGEEYRFVFLDGEIEYAYRRCPPQVIGDGEHSLSELIAAHNEYYELSDKKMISLDSPFLQTAMEKGDLSADSVLAVGEKFRIAAKANIDVGGSIDDYHKSFSKQCREWCKKLSDVVNLRICGIDVFVTGDFDDPENFIILEVNRNPFLKGIYRAGYPEKALEVWKKILERYFEGV